MPDEPLPTCPSDGGPVKPADTAGNPVVLYDGNKIEREVDFVANGEEGLHLQRVYNHYWFGVGIFGKHWLSNFDFKLTFGWIQSTDSCYPRPGGGTCGIGTNNRIYALRPDGSANGYLLNPADGIFYETKAGPVSKIVKQANGDFVLYGEGDQVETYSSAGYIKSVKNAHGVGWTFAYVNTTYPSRVTHTSGRYIEFIWTGSQLTAVRDPAQNLYSYTYTANQFGTGLHRLASVTKPGSPVTTITYHYERTDFPAALTGKSFNGVRYSTFSYTGVGNYPPVSRTTHNGIETWDFTYEDYAAVNGPFITTYTNPLRKITKNIYFNGKLSKVWGVASTNCPDTTVETTYNATTGYPELVLDAKANATVFTYNAKGQLLSQTEAFDTPLERVTEYEWDPTHNRKRSETVLNVRKTSYTYTADNRIASVTQTNLLAPSPATNANQTRTTTHTYTKHPNGMLATHTVDGPLTGSGDAVVYSYDTYGNLTSVKNSPGHTVSYSNYNALGLPGRITNVNGGLTDYVYDARGRATDVKNYVNGAWHTTTYTYNAAELLESVTRPDGQIRHYVYDAARRLMREYEAESATSYAQKRYTYNNASLITRIDTERTTTPVSAPALSAPASNATGSYTVNWTSVADTASYRLEEKVNTGAWTEIQNTAAISKAISGKNNATYGYRVRACNAVGCGPYSPTINVVVSLSGPATPAMTAPPSYSYGGSYSAAWGSIPGATSYRLEESRNSGAWAEIYNAAGTSISFSKAMSATFSYRVRACNTVGCSGYSAVRTVTVEVEREPCPSCLVEAPPEEPSGSDAADNGGDQ